MKRLSVIVPIYNVEPFVERCLRSLEDQGIPEVDYEIICINDGSPDNSREVVCRLQKEFKNIVLIDQENQGVSQARNNGIDKACGRYLLFTDPDDYVESGSFSHILQTVGEQRAQVSFLGYTILNENETIRKQTFNEQNINQIYSGPKAYYLAHGNGQNDPDRINGIIFEASFLNNNNLRFLPDVPYLEDGELISRILCLAERCIFDGHSFYYRTTRQGSATNSELFYLERATNGFLLAAGNLKKFQQEQNLNEKQREFLNQPICKFVILVISSSCKPFGLRKICDVKRRLNELGFGKIKLDSVDSEFKKLGYFYNISVILLIIYQSIRNKIRLMHEQTNK